MNNVTDIDNLFAQARSTEPYLNDQGFTSKLSSQIQSSKQLSLGQESAVSIVATVLGCVVAYQFFPVGDLLQLVPAHLSITPVKLLGVSSLLATLAYWFAESKPVY